MERLPMEVVDIIFSFVPRTLTYNLNQKYLNKIFPILIKNKKLDKEFNSYIRYIILYDCSIFLNKIFENKFLYLTTLNNWKYKSQTFPNYIEYLRAYAIESSKTKCRNLIELYISKEPVSMKNRHKKIRRRNIKWSN